MSGIAELIAPLIMALVAIYGLIKRVDVYGALIKGAMEGLKVVWRIAPAIIAVLTAVYMLRASGLLDWMTQLMAPFAQLVGIPSQCLPLMMVRPFSGSGALASAGEIMRQYGPDSYVGRVAAIMVGSTETTFYTLAVYLGSAGVKKARHAVPAALLADMTGFIVAAYTARFM